MKRITNNKNIFNFIMNFTFIKKTYIRHISWYYCVFQLSCKFKRNVVIGSEVEEEEVDGMILGTLWRETQLGVVVEVVAAEKAVEAGSTVMVPVVEVVGGEEVLAVVEGVVKEVAVEGADPVGVWLIVVEVLLVLSYLWCQFQEFLLSLGLVYSETKLLLTQGYT